MHDPLMLETTNLFPHNQGSIFDKITSYGRYVFTEYVARMLHALTQGGYQHHKPSHTPQRPWTPVTTW